MEQYGKQVEQMKDSMDVLVHKHEVEQSKARILDGFMCNNAHPQVSKNDVMHFQYSSSKCRNSLYMEIMVSGVVMYKIRT